MSSIFISSLQKARWWDELSCTQNIHGCERAINQVFLSRSSTMAHLVLAVLDGQGHCSSCLGSQVQSRQFYNYEAVSTLCTLQWHSFAAISAPLWGKQCRRSLLVGARSPADKIKPPPMRGGNFVGGRVSLTGKSLTTPAFLASKTFVGLGIFFVVVFFFSHPGQQKFYRRKCSVEIA